MSEEEEEMKINLERVHAVLVNKKYVSEKNNTTTNQHDNFLLQDNNQ